MKKAIQYCRNTLNDWKEIVTFHLGSDSFLSSEDPWDKGYVSQDIEEDMRRIRPIGEDTRFKIVKPVSIVYSLQEETLAAIKTLDDDVFEYQTYVAGALFMAGLHDAGREILAMKEEDYVTYLMFALGDSEA